MSKNMTAPRLRKPTEEDKPKKASAESLVVFMETVVQDVWHGFRALRKSPGFAVMAILTLAVGIGANTAIFSLLNAVLIRPLPYGNPTRLVYVWTPFRSFPQFPIEATGPSYGDFFDLQRESHCFSEFTLFDQQSFNLALEDVAQRVGGALVQPSFFSTFQVTPMLGRPIETRDVESGQEHVVVISYALWRSNFGGGSEILHKSLVLDGQRYHVIGVMPPSFAYPRATELPYSSGKTDVWLPLVLTPQQKTDRDNSMGNAIGRLRPGATAAQAQAELNSIIPRLDALRSPNDPFKGMYAIVRPLTETVVQNTRPFLWLLAGAVFLVLLIACANTANLLLARAITRQPEIAMRAALGAGRPRLVRQLLTEALLLACMAGALGILVSQGATRILLLFNPGNIPRLSEMSVDARVLLFALGISMVTAVVFGTIPAISASRTNLSETMKVGCSRGTSRTSKGWHGVLIVAEVALAVMLLASSGLLVRSYLKLAHVPTGFSDSTLTMSIVLDSRYSKPEERRDLFRSAIQRIGELPGVKAIGAVDDLPLSHSETMAAFTVEGYANQKGQLVESRLSSEDYFEAMGIPLIAGRFFTVGDGAAAMIVNEAFAKKYFVERPAVGEHVCTCYLLGNGKVSWSTVVGVVGNVHDHNLEQGPPPVIYRPFWLNGDAPSSAYIAVRSFLPAVQLVPGIRPSIREIDPTLAVSDVETMGQRIWGATALQRFRTLLFGFFGGTALFLAAVGLYGVMAYAVKQRTVEIGIRLALGAQPRHILGGVISQGIKLTLLGIILGTGGAFAVARMLRTLLYGIAYTDSLTFVMVTVIFLSTAVLSCYFPARRAMRVQPVTALRQS